MTIKVFINRYHIWIIVVLMLLILIRGCRSCSNKQNVAFERARQEAVCDSLKSVIGQKDSTIAILRDSLVSTGVRLDCAQQNLVRADNERTYQQDMNKALIKQNNNLIKGQEHK